MKITLTEREYEILESISKGMTNREIAEKFCIEINTVKCHITNIYQKSGLFLDEVKEHSVMRLRIALKFLNNEFDYKIYKQRKTERII